MGPTLMVPILPAIMQSLIVSEKSIGLVSAVYTFPAAVLSPIFGILTDRYGRKEVLVPTLILYGSAGVCAAFAATFQQFLFLRVLQGMGVAGMMPLTVIIIGDLFKGEEQIKAMGINVVGIGAGAVVLPILSGILSSVSWRVPLLLNSAAIPLAFFVLFFLKTPIPEKEQSEDSYLRTTLKFLAHRKAVAVFEVGLVLFIMLYGPFLNYLPIWMESKYNAAPVLLGVPLALMEVVVVLMASRAQQIAAFFGVEKMVGIGMSCYVIGLVFIPWTTSIYTLFIAAIIYGIGHGLTLPSLYVILARLAPLEHRGGVVSIFNIIKYVGQSTGPLVCGFLLFYVELSTIFTIMGGFGALAIFIWIALAVRQ